MSADTWAALTARIKSMKMVKLIIPIKSMKMVKLIIPAR